MANKSKNPYTDGILAVIQEYSLLKQNADKNKIPPIMSERQTDAFSPVNQVYKKHGINPSDFNEFRK